MKTQEGKTLPRTFFIIYFLYASFFKLNKCSREYLSVLQWNIYRLEFTTDRKCISRMHFSREPDILGKGNLISTWTRISKRALVTRRRSWKSLSESFVKLVTRALWRSILISQIQPPHWVILSCIFFFWIRCEMYANIFRQGLFSTRRIILESE